MRSRVFICGNKYEWRILSFSRVPTDLFTFRRTYQRLVVFAISQGREDIWSYWCHLGSYFVLFVPEGDTDILKAYQFWAQWWDHCYKFFFNSLFWFFYPFQRKCHDSINRRGISIIRHRYQKCWKWIPKNSQHEVERVAESKIAPNWHVFISIFGQ